MRARIAFFGADPARLEDLVGRAGELLRRAVLTDAVLPDRERPQGFRGSLPEMSPRDRIEAFGHDAALAVDRDTREELRKRAERFKPSRADIGRCNTVLSWLGWLKHEDDQGLEGVAIIRSAAFKFPYARMAARLGVSDDTVRRRHLGAVTRIAAQFQLIIEVLR